MDREQLEITPEIRARISLEPTTKRPQEAWEFLIACDLFLAALGPGVFIMAVLADWAGFHLAGATATPIDGWTWNLSSIFLLWGPFASALGGCLVFLHLGRNRYRLPTAAMNPGTSWMARGVIIMAGFVVLGCSLALVSVLFPSVPGRLGVVWHVLQVVTLLFALGTVLYTGLLLRSMKYVAFWDSPLLPVLFLASALSMGSMGIIIGAGIHGYVVSGQTQVTEIVRAMWRVEVLTMLVQAGVLALYLRDVKRRNKPEGLLSLRSWVSGPWRYRFWGGIVGLGLAFPLVLLAAGAGLDSSVPAVVGAASGIVGGLVLRLGVLSWGVKEAIPVYKYGEWRVGHPLATPSEGASPGGR
jgi:polysulfide reductase chain C